MGRPVAWGARWLDDLVAAGLVDATHLGRARGAVARGDVGDVVIEPVAVSGVVRGRSSLERRVRLGFRRVPADGWDTAVAIVASSSRWVAAVLGGDLPDALNEQLADRGCRLVPGAGDVSIDCSCSDSVDRCVHAAALCSHLAAVIDGDPLLLVDPSGR